MKKSILVLLLVTAFKKSSAQISIGYLPFQSLLSITSNTEKLAWVDFKMETNTFASNLNMEISPKINFISNEYVNYYVGAGLAFNPSNAYSDVSITNGYFLDFGARIKPLNNHRNFQVIFELSPYINNDFTGGNFRARLGLAWNFGKSKVQKQ